MDKATLTISLPQIMKDYISAKLSEGRFSTPSEYIRSLIRADQDMNGNGNGDRAPLRRRGAVEPETIQRPLAKSGRRRK